MTYPKNPICWGCKGSIPYVLDILGKGHSTQVRLCDGCLALLADALKARTPIEDLNTHGPDCGPRCRKDHRLVATR